MSFPGHGRHHQILLRSQLLWPAVLLTCQERSSWPSCNFDCKRNLVGVVSLVRVIAVANLGFIYSLRSYPFLASIFSALISCLDFASLSLLLIHIFITSSHPRKPPHHMYDPHSMPMPYPGGPRYPIHPKDVVLPRTSLFSLAFLLRHPFPSFSFFWSSQGFIPSPVDVRFLVVC